MAKEDEGLKEEEKTLPSEDDPSENDTTEEPDVIEDTPEDSVTISRTELEKLKEERENYRKGMLSAKRVKRTLKADGETLDDEEYLTRKDLYKANEEVAIGKAIRDVPEIDEHWGEVMAYYAPRRGRGTVEGTVLDIKDAYYLWQKDNPSIEVDTKEKLAKKAKADLSSLPSNPAKGKEKEQKAPKKHIMPEATDKMADWYK